MPCDCDSTTQGSRSAHQRENPRVRTLVLALGNPILGDDAVGFHILREVRRLHERERRCDSDQAVHFEEICGSGIDLLLETEGYDRLIVLDAYRGSTAIPGRLRVLEQKELCAPSEAATIYEHFITLPTALEVGRRLGAHMPSDVSAVVVEIGEAGLIFGETLSADVAAAVPEAASTVISLLVREEQQSS